MSDIITNVDMSVFDIAVRRIVDDLHIAFPTAVRTAARQLDEELLKLTWPKSQAQGRAAVKRDIGYAMMLLDPDKIHNKVLAQAVADQEFDVVQAFISQLRGRGGFLSNFTLKHFDPSLHQSVRNRRGRVPRSQKVAVLEKREYNNYVKQVQGYVGATKSAWGQAGVRLGATSIPGWILKHRQHGDYQEDMNGTNPSVVMANRGPGIDSLSSGLVQLAVNRRASAMTRDVDQVLQGRASRYFPSS